jgi:hypothetical protein
LSKQSNSLKKEKRAGVRLTAAENVQQASVEDKKLPPPLPQTVAEKAKVKAEKVRSKSR